MATNKADVALAKYYKAQMDAKYSSNKVIAVTYSDARMPGYLIGDAYSLFHVGKGVCEKLPVLHTTTDVPQKMTKFGPEPWFGFNPCTMFEQWCAAKGKTLKLTKAIMEIGGYGDCRVFVDTDGNQVLVRRDMLNMAADTYDDLILWHRFERLSGGGVKIVHDAVSKDSEEYVVGIVMPLVGNKNENGIDLTPPETTPAEEVA